MNTAVTPDRPPAACDCQIMGVTPLSTDTFQFELQSGAGTTPGYRAGQHLQLALDVDGDGQSRTLSYSIASSFNPERPRCLQLFIQRNTEFSDKVIKRLSQLSEVRESVKVTLPMGQVFLKTNLELPHIFIAAGSGIAQIKALAEDALRKNPEIDLKIYWSNKRIEDFYLLDLFQQWEAQHPNLSFTPILESSDSNWQGRAGYIYEVLEQDFENLDPAQVYLCGSPQMVYGTIDRLQPRGLREENCYSDVFEYAPRDK